MLKALIDFNKLFVRRAPGNRYCRALAFGGGLDGHILIIGDL